MKKQLVASQNRRNFNAAVHSKKNDAGLDETVFKSFDEIQSERQKWIEKKAGLERLISISNTNISKARNARTRRGDHSAELDKLEDLRASLIKEKNKCDVALANLKIDRLAAREKLHSRLDKMFFLTAREMLAEDVFNRILLAATHRAGDDV